MIAISTTFVKSAVTPDQYPLSTLPEIAFAGRSNVGKSSLINTLVRRRRLVKTSKTPGRTQTLNFFLADERLSLVDLPGYGYARVPLSVKRAWGPMVETYLTRRSTLCGVVLIMDIRRTPGDEELRFCSWLAQRGIPPIHVLTKADKLSSNRQTVQQAAAARALDVAPTDLILFSAKTRRGYADLWRAIDAVIGQKAPPEAVPHD